MPSFTLIDTKPLVQATGRWNSSIPTYFNRAPANFSFPAFANLKVNTDSNYLPVRFQYLRANVYDLVTLNLVATGGFGKRTLPGKSFPEILLPLNFTYLASNDTDQTCKHLFGTLINISQEFPGKNFYDACKNTGQYIDGKRPRTPYFIKFE